MYIDELAGKGLTFEVLTELIYYFALTFVPMALPLAILLASLMTFGNMGEFSELTALKASGVPLQRIMRPLIFLLAFFCVISFFFSNNVLPYATLKAKTLLYDIRKKKPDVNIQAGTFYNGVPDYNIKVAKKNPETGLMQNIIIYDHSENRGNVSVTTADSGYMKLTEDETGLILILYNGKSFTELPERKGSFNYKTYPSRQDAFMERTVVIPLTGFDLERSEEGLLKSRAEMMNIAQLTSVIDSLNSKYTEKVEFGFKEFNEVKLYYEKNYIPGYAVNGFKEGTDTANKKELIKFDARSIFDSLPVLEKRTVLAKSIEDLKDAASFLSVKNESLHFDIRNIKRYEVEWNKKLTMSFACLVFFFIGAPLGALIRKGGLGTPAVISIFFFVIYYVMSLSGQKMVEEDVLGTFAGMWASSYILLPIGVFLTYKATTDSVIMNVDTYISLLKNFKNYLYRIFMNGRSRNPVVK
jgi:lipopolysaccharide export system permease protein